MFTRGSRHRPLLPVLLALAVVTGVVGGVSRSQLVQASGPTAPSGTPQFTTSGCPLVFTKQANFSMGSSTGTVVLNLYASTTLYCFNGYERIYVSSGSDEFSADSAGADWLQYWFSSNGGTTYTPICAYFQTCNTADEYLACTAGYPGGPDVDAAFNINYSNYGDCIGTSFTFPRTSMAWVEDDDWTDYFGGSQACVLIQNTPNLNFPYTMPEEVFDIHGNTYQVPTLQLSYSGAGGPCG